MPVKPTTILLVPNGKLREALLAEGPYEARPPMAYENKTCAHHTGWRAAGEWEVAESACHMCSPAMRRYALVLAQDGKQFNDGVDRLGRVVGMVISIIEAWVSHVLNRPDEAESNPGWGLKRLSRYGDVIRLDAIGEVLDG